MRAIDGAKVRAVVVAMAIAALIQVWPSAHAQVQPERRSKRKDTSMAVPVRVMLLNDPVAIVLKTAHAQLGKPYRWGAMGPDSFDCSGFTGYVWDKAGVALPRTSSAQRAVLPDVPLAEMEPGDLVFAPGHVGIYIGDGKMIHSPHSGETVEVAPIHDNAYAGGRPAA